MQLDQTPSRFLRFFRSSADEQQEAMAEVNEKARECLDWATQSYHEKFMKWLDDEASKPIEVSSDHNELIKAAVRANVLKEIMRHIRREVSASAAVIERAKEEQE